MLWSAALFFYVYYTPAVPDCQRLLPLQECPIEQLKKIKKREVYMRPWMKCSIS